MLQAASAVYGQMMQQASRLRDASEDSSAVAREALARLRESAANARAYQESALFEPPAEISDDTLRAFLALKHPNVPLAAFGEKGADCAEALIELNIGLCLETAAEPVHSSEPSEACAEACTHYLRSATLDGSTARVFLLWEAAAQRDASHHSHEARLAAVAKVHRAGVDAGVWALPEQRPERLIPGLIASAWHDPLQHAACRTLEREYPMIRAEALALLQQDPEQHHFTSYTSKALAAGDWCDVGLYYNAMRNSVHSQRAPCTSALLCGDEAGFRRDCTSCSLGSAYFSLLRPHTRLAAHCGPTNARLRAHLGIVVPEGDCEIIVGGESRRWAEGKVLLFDDSFEHAVHNETDEPRLVLIVDMWHPQLTTDEQRTHAMQDDEQRERYRQVIERSYYKPTVLRGH